VYNTIKWYYRKARIVHFEGIRFKLFPSVFHPKLYLTTKTLLSFVKTLDIGKKSILELGCGSGILSMLLANDDTVSVFASDINKNAVEGLRYNSSNQGVNIEIYHSDLFLNIPLVYFDIILINPPFFPGEITIPDQYGFFTGLDYEYFHRLNQQLISRVEYTNDIYMILTDQCELSDIFDIFSDFNFTILYEKNIYSESHIIYKISYKNGN
jgi:Methylase of polypeptide chain release factors